MRDGERANVGVDHPGIQAGLLSDLVHIFSGRGCRNRRRGLADTGRGEEPHHTAEERPVSLGGLPGH